MVAVKVASQNLPTSGAQASAASPRKTVPERYDELASKMTQYETELQTSAVTAKTVKEDAKNLLRWLVEIKKQLEGLRPLQEDIDMLQNKVLQFKVHIIVLHKQLFIVFEFIGALFGNVHFVQNNIVNNSYHCRNNNCNINK